MPKKSYAYKPSTFPTRQCTGCGKFYHARSKICPNCGTPNQTRDGSPDGDGPVVKRKKIRRMKKIRSVPSRANSGSPLDHAISFVEAAGGVEQAREALSTIERIRSL